MLKAWLRKKPIDDQMPLFHQPIAVGRSMMTDDVEFGYDRDQWDMPLEDADLEWRRPEPSKPLPSVNFRFDDLGPDPEPWRGEGWWLRAIPSIKLPRPLKMIAGPAPWPKVADPLPKPSSPVVPISSILRGSDRIERLRAAFAGI